MKRWKPAARQPVAVPHPRTPLPIPRTCWWSRFVAAVSPDTVVRSVETDVNPNPRSDGGVGAGVGQCHHDSTASGGADDYGK